MAISFKHSCNVGDLIAALPGIRQVCQDLKQKAVIYQELNVRANYYEGATHPVTNNGEQVCMNELMFDMVKPLILSQPYVEDFRVFNDQKIIVNLDVIRDQVDEKAKFCFANVPAGMIQSWLMLAYPDMATDLSKPWLDVEANSLLKDKGILNYTERYRNPKMEYYFLKKYQDALVFAGTEKEHAIFCSQWKLDIPYLKVDDFLDLAQSMKGALFMAGNQSANWNIANAMGVPRILEMCYFAPNCQPFVGESNFGYYHQGAAEYFFERLFNGAK